MAAVRLWDVPTAVWAYGLFRAAAFVVPFATGTGGFGLGVVVVPVLWVLLIRGSRAAWVALLVLDLLSAGLLIATWRTETPPLVLPIAAGLALVMLVLPSTRRHVARHSRGPA